MGLAGYRALPQSLAQIIWGKMVVLMLSRQPVCSAGGHTGGVYLVRARPLPTTSASRNLANNGSRR